MRLLLADDEPLALRRLKLALDTIADVEVVGEARDGLQAVEAMRALRPDLVLLDIRMPLMDGFEVVNAAGDAGAPAIIFVSAYDSYAARAFAAAAIDYLVKPVEFQRLSQALERARAARSATDAQRRIDELASVVEALRTEARAREPNKYDNEFWIRDRGRFVRVPIADIDRIEAERDYVRIHWEGRTLLHRVTMAQLERTLDPEAMLRVHRSAFINWRRLKSVQRDSNGRLTALLADGAQVSVSRAYAQRVLGDVRSKRDEVG